MPFHSMFMARGTRDTESGCTENRDTKHRDTKYQDTKMEGPKIVWCTYCQSAGHSDSACYNRQATAWNDVLQKYVVDRRAPSAIYSPPSTAPWQQLELPLD